MRKLKVLERLFYRPLLDEERSHMPREMVERLFPNLEEVSEESPVTDEFLKLGDFLVVVQLIRRPTMPKQKKYTSHNLRILSVTVSLVIAVKW